MVAGSRPRSPRTGPEHQRRRARPGPAPAPVLTPPTAAASVPASSDRAPLRPSRDLSPLQLVEGYDAQELRLLVGALSATARARAEAVEHLQPCAPSDGERKACLHAIRRSQAILAVAEAVRSRAGPVDARGRRHIVVLYELKHPGLGRWYPTTTATHGGEMVPVEWVQQAGKVRAHGCLQGMPHELRPCLCAHMRYFDGVNSDLVLLEVLARRAGLDAPVLTAHNRDRKGFTRDTSESLAFACLGTARTAELDGLASRLAPCVKRWPNAFVYGQSLQGAIANTEPLGGFDVAVAVAAHLPRAKALHDELARLRGGLLCSSLCTGIVGAHYGRLQRIHRNKFADRTPSTERRVHEMVGASLLSLTISTQERMCVSCLLQAARRLHSRAEAGEPEAAVIHDGVMLELHPHVTPAALLSETHALLARADLGEYRFEEKPNRGAGAREAILAEDARSRDLAARLARARLQVGG